MDEIIMNPEISDAQEDTEETETEQLPAVDDTEYLEIDSIRRKKEGKADDSASMQTALCMIIAIGLIILNVFKPDIAEDLLLHMKKFSESSDELFRNPIDIVMGYINNK